MTLSLKDCQQEFSSPFEPLPPVEQVTHTPIEVNEIFIAPDIENLCKITMHYMTCQLHRWTKLNDLWKTHHPQISHI